MELRIKDKVLLKGKCIHSNKGEIIDIVKRRSKGGSYMMNRYLVMNNGISVLYWKSQLEFDVDYYRSLDE